jgi:hypothetical protein
MLSDCGTAWRFIATFSITSERRKSNMRYKYAEHCALRGREVLPPSHVENYIYEHGYPSDDWIEMNEEEEEEDNS